ncbi:MAG: hypothetical protein IMW93_07600 [Thermoanaerobacteraceae bacterium]|nr:hypothetical protein [Thermoanaerobacteraceae bacterium]
MGFLLTSWDQHGANAGYCLQGRQEPASPGLSGNARCFLTALIIFVLKTAILTQTRQTLLAKSRDTLARAVWMADIQTTLAKVSLLFREQGLAGLRKDGSLQYKDYEGSPGNIGHFRLNLGWRVSCLPEGNILRLRHVGPHDVNKNP